MFTFLKSWFKNKKSPFSPNIKPLPTKEELNERRINLCKALVGKRYRNRSLGPWSWAVIVEDVKLDNYGNAWVKLQHEDCYRLSEFFSWFDEVDDELDVPYLLLQERAAIAALERKTKELLAEIEKSESFKVSVHGDEIFITPIVEESKENAGV